VRTTLLCTENTKVRLKGSSVHKGVTLTVSLKHAYANHEKWTHVRMNHTLAKASDDLCPNVHSITDRMLHALLDEQVLLQKSPRTPALSAFSARVDVTSRYLLAAAACQETDPTSAIQIPEVYIYHTLY
jgi:hypothetical protein